MKSLFGPAVGLMNRLTYPRKFLLISVLFAVPLALVTVFLFAEINASLDIARLQTRGLRYLTAVQPLFRAVQEQMEAMVSSAGGDDAEARRTKNLGQVTQGLATLERADKELGRPCAPATGSPPSSGTPTSCGSSSSARAPW